MAHAFRHKRLTPVTSPLQATIPVPPHRDPLCRSKRGQRGSTLILFTLLVTLVLIPLIGLAVDGAVVFWVKAKLSSAVDAAAIAAGRSINISLGAGQNSPTAITAAQQWFAANFPAGWLGTSVVGGQPTVVFNATSSSTQQVSVTASAIVPLFFMRLLHINTFTVTATAQSSRRNLNLVLVLDRSGSMGAQGSNACPIMIAAAQNFVNLFTDGFDTLGLVTFSSSANWNSGSLDYTPTMHFKTGSPSLNTVLGQITCQGATSSAQGLHVAYQSIQNTALPSAVNAIVFFTDGQPNEVVANYTTMIAANGGGDTRYDSLNTSSLVTMPASTCTSSTVTGGLTTALVQGTSPGITGYTGGIFDTSTWVPLSMTAGIISAPGCSFVDPNSYCQYYAGAAWACVRQDVASIPNQDIYGNVTNSGYKGLPDTIPSGSPYVGQIRVDEQTIAVMAAAFNAADHQATTIRNDTTYNPIIFSIGLDGAPDMSIDSTFLERVANDPRSPIYDSTRAAGYYAYAENPGELNQAFHQIASIVLRLSK